MRLFSGMSADKSADAAADALAIIIHGDVETPWSEPSAGPGWQQLHPCHQQKHARDAEEA